MATSRLCSIPNCGKPAKTRGWCSVHWWRWRHRGDPLYEKFVPQVRYCSIEGCEKVHFGRGWCNNHYNRWRSHGHPLAGQRPRDEAHRYLEDVVLPFTGSDCLIWPYTKGPNGGYGQIGINGRHVLVSRYVCERVRGAPPSRRHEAAHDCGRGHVGCVNPNHLVWKTPSANQMDRVRHGTSNRGERNKQSKLTSDEVRAIRRMKGSMKLTEIGAAFGVHQSTVSEIHSRKLWGWLP